MGLSVPVHIQNIYSYVLHWHFAWCYRSYMYMQHFNAQILLAELPAILDSFLPVTQVFTYGWLAGGGGEKTQVK